MLGYIDLNIFSTYSIDMHTTKRILDSNRDLVSFASYVESCVRVISIQDVIDKITLKRTRAEIGAIVSDTIGQVKKVLSSYC